MFAGINRINKVFLILLSIVDTLNKQIPDSNSRITMNGNDEISCLKKIVMKIQLREKQNINDPV